MNGFFICPVRGADTEKYRVAVEGLGKDGWNIHWPPRDTNQEDDSGIKIWVNRSTQAPDQTGRLVLTAKQQSIYYFVKLNSLPACNPHEIRACELTGRFVCGIM